MKGAITDVPGFLVGQAQDAKAATGCTVILCPDNTVAGVDVRGGAPGTRETDCLDSANVVPCVHGIYLGGGSAFGLAGAEGVMRYLEERGKGFNVGPTTVPIIPGAVLFDLTVGDFRVRPDAAMGYKACQAAGKAVEQGNAGAGTGATVGKAAGAKRAMKGGLGTASLQVGDLVVGAIVAVNCFGDIVDQETGEILAGALKADGAGFARSISMFVDGTAPKDPFAGSNTTIGVVACNARFDKNQARRLAIMTQDGFARAINPIHTMHDGDSVFALCSGPVEADITVVGSLAAHVMAAAIANAVINAATAYGFPGHAEIMSRIAAGR